jgi:hypothetical protein
MPLITARTMLSVRSWRMMRDARCAECGAERHFRFAAHTANEEKIGDVSAGDEEDESGNPHEHVEVGFVLLLKVLNAAAGGRENDVRLGEGFFPRGPGIGGIGSE